MGWEQSSIQIRTGVELVRANFVPTRELITLDFPTFDRPRKAISGNSKAGKCATSVAAARNRVRTLMPQCAMQDGKLASEGEVQMRGTECKRPAIAGLETEIEN